MPNPPLPPTPATAFADRIWLALRRTDTSLSMAALGNLTSRCSEVMTLLKRPKRPVRPTKLRIVK